MKSRFNSEMLGDPVYRAKIKEHKAFFRKYFFWLGLSNDLWFRVYITGLRLYRNYYSSCFIGTCFSLLSLARASANRQEDMPLSGRAKVYKWLES